MLQNLLSRLPWFSTAARSGNRLSQDEVELISLIRQDPHTPLQGSDLAKAHSLTSRGMLRPAGVKRFIVTEKAVAACRQPRG